MCNREYEKLMKEKREFLKKVVKSRDKNKPIKEEKYVSTTPSWSFSQTPRFEYPYVIYF